MDKKKTNAEVEVSINFDTTPILYTDNISLTSNEDGVVFDVMQRAGNTNKVRIVSRIGMSRSHAIKFLKEFNNLLTITEGQKETEKTN